MLKNSCQFFVILLVVNLVKCAVRDLPPYIEPCSQSDPNINQCIVTNGNKAIPNMQNGDKTYKIPSVNPLRVNEAVLEPGSNLRLAIKNIDVYGLDKIRILDADCQLDKNKLQLTLFIPKVQLIGDYEINGRLVILPITGNGRVNITSTSVDADYNLLFSKESQNGVEQLIIKENTVEYKAKRIYYDFTNLFNGEERLANEMKKFLNESWKEIDTEFHGSFQKIIAAILQNLLSQVVKDIPFDKVFIPYLSVNK